MENPNHIPKKELQNKLREFGYKGGFEVMEMLDVIPNTIGEVPFIYGLIITKNSVGYNRSINNRLYKENNNKPLPDMLAEMIIWLVENKYLTFNK